MEDAKRVGLERNMKDVNEESITILQEFGRIINKNLAL